MSGIALTKNWPSSPAALSTSEALSIRIGDGGADSPKQEIAQTGRLPQSVR